MKRSGAADLPLHYGYVPTWLSERMAKLGLAITEALIADYGKTEVIRRLSDPFWFQSLGAVMGMDWHSSGVTTSVMGALKRAINPHSRELGIYICGGKGKFSRQAPEEIRKVCESTGLDGDALVRCSKLSAKVDNTAVQDGFQLYMHSFVLSDEGQWTVIQQGMSEGNSMARRYHWHSANLASFVNGPHTAICGANQGMILNMADTAANPARNGVLTISREKPEHMMQDIQQLVMPSHHDVRTEDVDLKRLGAVLWLAHEKQPSDFEELLLLEGVGPRTLQSLALVSEVIHGTPVRFRDPARFAFAHGGKDGHPFPVPIKVYDETISILQTAVHKAKVGQSDKKEAIRQLSELARKAEKDFTPTGGLDQLIEKERDESWMHGGRTVFGKARPPAGRSRVQQLRMF
ncbi:DUF763 domain-containing protein [Flavitalea sp. BT771]|uniref:DUF763 domain-containing protein n=1 Tax=Flavitalea sp. BT771 TaxID=3063329 RepID=UPI0026E223EC|nr:DUF763 domain-containing protein [Flavitalea sp. BT771]MDO6434223.1 DUF763 domain-containing protein [Flavitalea sp. BT771]MDV6223123.1 DUF763 domain-containing protein [Flavitalea sp. BT771]